MYQHILVAADLTEECDQILNKAIALQKFSSAKLTMVHVVEPISYTYGGDIPLDLGDIQLQLENTSHQRLETIVAENDLQNTTCKVLIGRAETEIHHYAEENGVDLIVTGSHGRHGLQLLLGSTANGILHGVQCDVLAVRIGK